MNTVNSHLSNKAIKFSLTESKLDGAEAQYRALEMGFGLTIFINDDQLEELFDLIDKKLHKETYLNLQDKIFGLEADVEESKTIIEHYEELALERENRNA